MRSRAVRFVSTTAACLALAGAAVYLEHTTQLIDARTTTRQRFDAAAREAIGAVASARAAQRGYVAAAQNSSVWMPQVQALSNQAAIGIDTLRGLAATNDARQALLDASASLAEFAASDRQARDYLAADQALMASDVVFTAAAEASTDVEHQIGDAIAAENAAFGTSLGDLRRRQTYAGAGAGAFAVLMLLALGLSGRERAADRTGVEAAQDITPEHDSLQLRIASTPPESAAPAPASAAITDDAPPREAIALNAAAGVCTTFGRVQDVPGLKRALADAAAALDASGLVVWLGSVEGADLQPVVAHGYSDQILAMMRPVPMHAENAAAAAYRTSKLQIVPAKPGTSLGAVVAPILAAEGCIGALTAEIRDNGEVSDVVHAVATIFASQLSGVLASSASRTETQPAARAASA